MAVTGLCTLLPVRGFSGPIIACEGVGDGAECSVDYGQSRTLTGFTVEHRGDLEGPDLGHDTLFVIGLMVTAVAVLVAVFLVHRSARFRRT